MVWYQEGLRFKCTGCGACCTGAPGFVWIEEDEILTMAAHLKLSPEEFVRKYVRLVGDRASLREIRRGDQHDCIFLEGKRCSLYEARPRQCRQFPWWSRNLESREAWLEAARDCEGINHLEAPLHTVEEIERLQSLDDPL